MRPFNFVLRLTSFKTWLPRTYRFKRLTPRSTDQLLIWLNTKSTFESFRAISTILSFSSSYLILRAIELLDNRILLMEGQNQVARI